tara:strand:+ start:4054 stop:4374 length:321 start_codon:yes stop_codon:yes gene_type:complete
MQKQKAIRDRKFLDWLRDQPCIVTGANGSDHETVDPAHLRWNTGGGTGLKPSDCFANPLLHSEHIKQGDMGEKLYWLEAVNNDPQILADFMADALRWRYFVWKGVT